MKLIRNKLCTSRLLAVLALLAGPAIQAQTANTPATPAKEGEGADETIVLSPFVVSAEEDTGYVASSSLAGTRIKTNLDDIAAAISVVTKDMMRDLGANNSGVLLNYTLGTEVSGIGGNFSGASTAPNATAEDGVNRELFSQTRVRGLAGADNTRDFFLTSVPWDGFNTDRIEISRGPNATLFGTGSPAGIINMSTIKANASRNKTEVLFEVSNFGSTRAQFDNNTKIIDGVLGVRTAFTSSDQRFQQEEAYIRDARAFVSAFYKPFKHTTIRANYEVGEQNAAKPEWRPPFDNGIMSWFEVGMPAVNPLTQVTTLMGPVAPGIRYSGVNNEGRYQGSNVASGPKINIITGMTGFGSNNPTLFFDQPNALGTSMYGLNGVWALTNIGAPITGQRGNQMVAMANSYNYMRQQSAGLPFSQYMGERQITDSSIFNYFDHMLDSNKKEDAKWRVNSISIEQLAPNGKGGIEFSYHKENLNKGFVNPINWATYGISIDINTHLLDGRVNPNFGRPMLASDSWSTETRESRESKRITGFYELEAKFGPKWLQGLLGRHTFTGSISESERYSVTRGGRHLAAGAEWAFQNPRIFYGRNYPTVRDNLINNASRGFQTAVYLGDKANTAQGMNIKPVTVDVLLNGIDEVPVHYFHTQYTVNPTTNVATVVNDVGNWRAGSVSILRGSTYDKSAVDLDWTGGQNRSTVDSKVLIMHSNMLWDTILPTLGYRKDTLKFFQAGTVVDGAKLSISKAPLPSAPNSQFQQETFNWGAVARLPASIQAKLPFGLRPTVFYNKSDNFEPTQQRINAFGEPIAPLRGETTDFGFLISALDNKLSLRFTKYDTALAGKSVDMRGSWHRLTREGLGQVNNAIANGWNDQNAAAKNAYTSWWSSDPFAANIKKTFEFGASGGPSGTTDGRLVQTTDSQSKGNEIELTYNPTPNWRMALNYSEAEVINTNTALDFVQFLEKWKAVMNTAVGQIYRNYPGVNNDSGETLREFSERTYTDVIRQTAGDGQPANPELRKKRVNFITNYSFHEGALKNFGAGGAIRWEDEVLIGTGFKVDSLLGEVPDYSKPYMGPTRTTYDAWISYRRPEIYKKVDLQVRLNVRNIGVGDKLVPVSTQPDGTVRAWRISEPMTVTLSTEFSF